MNTNEKYRKAYKEVFYVLCVSPDSVWSKIPEKKIKFYFYNMDRNYDFYFNDISEMKLMHETKAILANLYINYLANDEQIQEIYESDRLKAVEKEKLYQSRLEEVYKSKKNNDIFVKDNQSLIEVKKSFFQKIMEKIKNIFVKNK